MSIFKINKLTPIIGAEIIGENIFNNLSSDIYDEIYNCLIENKVIFFRNQKITSEQHINFAKNFGEIEPHHPIYPSVDKYPEIVLLENGIISEIGKHDELMKKPGKYRELCEKQFIRNLKE